jgi:hypothetical protein
MVVGQRGERRLVKRFAEREIKMERAVHGCSASGTKGPTRGRGATWRNERGRGKGRPRLPESGENKEDEVQETGARTRLNSKQARDEEEAEDPELLPGAKH